MEVTEVKELVKQIAMSLVDNSEAVTVGEREEDRKTVLELRVAEEDLGKVIGKQGRTARAIRTILTAASRKLGKEFFLEIQE